MLALERESRSRPAATPPENLVQALADLLLEALGARTAPSLPEREIGDEPEDHR